MTQKELAGRKISIIGAERSGIASAQLLRSAGATVFVSDIGNSERTQRHCDELRAQGIACEYGGHTESVFECSLMVISPGVPTNAPVVIEAQKRGIHVVAELEAASWFCTAPIIAITGSNGKTTTTTLLGRIFSDAKKKHVVAGNIGTAFSSVVLDIDEETVVLLEVSSFQLDFIETFRPKVGILLNITRNHMDRYEHSMDLYAASKRRMFMNQTADDISIINADDAMSNQIPSAVKGRKVSFSMKPIAGDGAFLENGVLVTRWKGKETSVVRTDEMSLAGDHNFQNAMAAVLAAQIFDIGPAYIRATLRNFKGVEHRQEFVREVDGVKYINNSKATTVEAVEMSLKSYHEPIILIMGGKDKGNDYSTIYDLVKQKVKAIIATGYSAETIVRNFSDKVPVTSVATIGTAIPNMESMEKAIAAARSQAARGDVILLSPACTSFDWFHDYEERGRVFKSLVMKL